MTSYCYWFKVETCEVTIMEAILNLSKMAATAKVQFGSAQSKGCNVCGLPDNICQYLVLVIRFEQSLDYKT